MLFLTNLTFYSYLLLFFFNQELTHSSKIFMRHVLWVDKNIVQKYRKKWIPVSHPLILTGRAAPLTITKIIGKETVENGEETVKNNGSGVLKGSEKVENDLGRNVGSASRDESSVLGVKRGLEESKIIIAPENKTSVTAVDDARKRFLARKKGK
jgi:hypothetical protein